MHVLWLVQWLVEDYIRSCYNHPAQGDYHTEALIFKIAAMQFFDVSEEKVERKNERKSSCSDSHL